MTREDPVGRWIGRGQRWTSAAAAGWLVCGLSLVWVSFAYPTLTDAVCDRSVCDFRRFYRVQAEVSWNGAERVVQGWYYPPALLFFLRPAVGLGIERAARWWVGVELVSVVALVACCVHALRGTSRDRRWGIAVPLVATSLPIWHALRWGQISLPLYAAIIGATILGSRLGGVASGVAAALKIYPIGFLLEPALRRDVGAVVAGPGTAVCMAVLLPMAVFGVEHTLDLLGSVADVSWQAMWASETQWLVRVCVKWFAFAPPGVGLGVAAAIAAALIHRTVRWIRRPAPREHRLAVVITSLVLVALPTGWPHAYAFLPWVHAVLWARARDEPGSRARIVACLVVSIAASCAPVVVATVWRPAIDRGVEAGAITIAALAAWIGLLQGTPRAAEDSGLSPATRQRLLEVAVVTLAILQALRALWLTDDAFISFRYAENLVAGHGLVFNPGERVEGITNPAWTLWIAVGHALGWRAEIWSTAWGMAFHGASCVLLVRLHRSFRLARGRSPGIPWAALAFALHPDVAIWATSGLEGAALTFLLLGAFVLSVPLGADGGPRPALSGAMLGLAALTRHDAILFAPFALLAILVATPGRDRRLAGRDASVWLGTFALVWLPVTLTRIAYYGDFFPNTYYAKSADVAWWSQGIRYVGLYYEQYFAYLLVFPLGLSIGRRSGVDRWMRLHYAACLGFALVYTAYLARVGGDFMFARLLVPTAPFVAWALEVATFPLAPRRRAVAWTAIVAGPLLVPRPVTLEHPRAGVADEWAYYTDPGFEIVWLQRSRVAWRYLRDLPVTVAFLGSHARTVRDAQIPIAIESETGLTDAVIAHQQIAVRSRPGHEKRAPPSYLIDERGAHLALGEGAFVHLGLTGVVPPLAIRLPDPDGILERGLTLWILRWDPAIMDALHRRGAIVPDLPGSIDDLITRLDEIPDEHVRQISSELSRVYFDHVDDPVRRAAFEDRLKR